MEGKAQDTPERSREAREEERKPFIAPELKVIMTLEEITGGPAGGNADAIIGSAGTGFQTS